MHHVVQVPRKTAPAAKLLLFVRPPCGHVHAVTGWKGGFVLLLGGWSSTQAEMLYARLWTDDWVHAAPPKLHLCCTQPAPKSPTQAAAPECVLRGGGGGGSQVRVAGTPMNST